MPTTWYHDVANKTVYSVDDPFVGRKVTAKGKYDGCHIYAHVSWTSAAWSWDAASQQWLCSGGAVPSETYGATDDETKAEHYFRTRKLRIYTQHTSISKADYELLRAQYELAAASVARPTAPP
ncbi:MAG: hypothetical protein ACHREM_24630 [Polyangiales bacterium]